jgi:threonine 3-dehydrogenase
MGADITVNSRDTDLPAFVRSQTDGVGADAVIDITGNPHAIRAGLKAVRKGGIFVSVGLPDGEVGINLTEDIIYREVIYTGVSGRLMFETWEDCMNILQSPGFSLEPVVGGIYPFRDFEKALDALKQGIPGKMILIP